VTLPHLLRLAWWIPPIFLALLLWRYLCTAFPAADRQPQRFFSRNIWLGFHQPSSVILLVIAIFALVGIAISYRTFGRDASVALLVILCGLKLLETKNQRDALLLCFLGYFLVVTNFLYSQTIPTVIYMLIVVIVMTATLVSLNDGNESLSTRQRFRWSITLLFQAIPLMIVIFILFPRMTGPLWNLPRDVNKATTGLDDSMTPGTVSELSLSDEIAFRVKFAGTMPPPAKLYWRGPVLTRTDGHRWQGNYQQDLITEELALQPLGEPVDYTVTLEPHGRRWLFALDLPAKAPPLANRTPDYQVVSLFLVQQRLRYEVRSYIDYRATTMSPLQRRFALTLPENKHPQARALAQTWRQQNPDPVAIIQRALTYFHEEPFVYTFMPELVLDDSVDQFLFETREGFCEHYASAFTVLMRAAGIPARIVTGYLGGHFNPVGNYLIVRQRDAHAWSEVWLEERGWVRIDPTSAVAPERIEQGIDRALPEDDSLGLGIEWNSDAKMARIWQQLRNNWDAINNVWNQWVLSYDTTRQRQLLGQLGIMEMNWRDLGITLIVASGGFLLGIAAWLLVTSRKVVCDPAQQIYLRFCQKLARRGVLRYPSEGPLNFAIRASLVQPDLAVAINHVVDLYVQIRYHHQMQLFPQLRTAVRQFRV